jgi:hypothetical protein
MSVSGKRKIAGDVAEHRVELADGDGKAGWGTHARACSGCVGCRQRGQSSDRQPTPANATAPFYDNDAFLKSPRLRG